MTDTTNDRAIRALENLRDAISEALLALGEWQAGKEEPAEPEDEDGMTLGHLVCITSYLSINDDIDLKTSLKLLAEFGETIRPGQSPEEVRDHVTEAMQRCGLALDDPLVAQMRDDLATRLVQRW
jgi:hypothetical protein